MGTARSSGQLGAQHRYIVFLPGLCGYTGSDAQCHGQVNAAARGRATFGTLIAALSHAHIAYKPVYYSYNGSTGGTYTVSQTHQTIGVSVDALERQLRAVYQRDKAARFVLVGHSLGGVVAASWAVSVGRHYGYQASHGLLKAVDSIVTFDSPLRGVRNVSLGQAVARAFFGPVFDSLQPSNETIREITFFSDSWWRSKGHLHTVGNRADLVVPAGEAVLGEARVVNDANCSRDLFIFSSCHGAVLADVALNRSVACHWIAGPTACSPPPLATPTAVPLTPTVLPSPTTSPAPPPIPGVTQAPPARYGE